MNNYLRPLSEDFMLNGKNMPKPHEFKTIHKHPNKDASRCVNTGVLITNPYNIQIYETTWKYKLLRDDQFALLYKEVFNGIDNYDTKSFRTLSSDTFRRIEYVTYEPDDFQSPQEVTSIQSDGHRYYKNVEFHFTSVGQVVEY